MENDIDTVVRDGTSNVFAAVTSLVRLSGQVSLASAQSPQLADEPLIEADSVAGVSGGVAVSLCDLLSTRREHLGYCLRCTNWDEIPYKSILCHTFGYHIS